MIAHLKANTIPNKTLGMKFWISTLFSSYLPLKMTFFKSGVFGLLGERGITQWNFNRFSICFFLFTPNKIGKNLFKNLILQKCIVKVLKNFKVQNSKKCHFFRFFAVYEALASRIHFWELCNIHKDWGRVYFEFRKNN